MIRLLSQEQSHSFEQPQAIRHDGQSSSTRIPSRTTSSKSPIKKHLQNATVLATPMLPSSSFPDNAHASQSSIQISHKAQLRASVLESILQLLDQDRNALAGVQEILTTIAKLPLSDPSIQRACVVALRGLQKPASKSPSWSQSSTCCDPLSRSTKPVNAFLMPEPVHHCQEFLLACANEVHDIDEKISSVDEAGKNTWSFSSLTKQIKDTRAVNMDYSSTVHESSTSFSGSSDICCDSDDTKADQGSEFSDVLYRAEFMSDIEERMTTDQDVHRLLSASERNVCRKVLQEVHNYVTRQRRRVNAADLVTKYRVFEALKLHSSFRRKRLVFQRLKSILRSRSGQDSSKPHAIVKTQRLVLILLPTLFLLGLLLTLVALVNLPTRILF